MEAAVSTGKVNYSKSKILRKDRKWNQSSASGDSEAQVGNRSEDAACSMAEYRRHTNQDAGSPRHAGARRSLLSQTQLHRVSKIFTSAAAPSCLPCSALKHRSLSRTGGWGGRRHKLLHGPGHGNVYVSWSAPLLSLPCPPSRVTHDLPPAQRSSFPKVDFSSAEQETPASARSSTTLPRLQLRRLTAEESGVFPCWDWIMDTIRCPSVYGAAQRVRVSTSPPSSARTGREGGEERSPELHPLWEGGAPSLIKLASLFNIHVKVPLTLMHTHTHTGILQTNILHTTGRINTSAAN